MTRPPHGDEIEPAEWIGGLYDRFGPSLYRYALMILADPSGAADVVQQVFVALLRSRAAIDSDERYLRRSVRNECYSALRRRRREIVSSIAGELLETASANDDRIDERIAVEQAMRDLPPEQREVVYLKAFEGLTFQEIAVMTGESGNTVASRYRYALDKLRERLLEKVSPELR
jgi:RNA polymerase sigma-70 factor (ECF subfamily)